MRFLLTLSLLFLFMAPSLAATKPQVDRIEVVSAGLFKSKVAKKVARSAASFTNLSLRSRLGDGTRRLVLRDLYDGRKLTEQKLTVT